MKMKQTPWVLGWIGISLCLGGCKEPTQTAKSTAAQEASVFKDFNSVDLDAFIAQEKSRVERFKGQKIIKMSEPVSFQARVKQLPREKKMSYIYSALEIAKVTPLPEVTHQMFVESAAGQIISVYVERRVAERMASSLKEGQSVAWASYHVYSYSKGPALLVVDFKEDSEL